MGGRKPFKLAGEAAWIHARLAEKPDITGRELLAELHARGVEVSYFAVWHFLDRAALSFKNVWPAPSASGFGDLILVSLHQRIRPLWVQPRPRWRSARPGPHKNYGVGGAIFEARFP